MRPSISVLPSNRQLNCSRYTTTGFDPNGTQPGPGNPLGNPPYPGYTAANGPNWIDFLTVTYNASFIETVNLAYGGAVVDDRLIQQYLPTVLSMRNQVEDEFIPIYADGSEGTFQWNSKNTLFASFLGINDVGNAYSRSNASDIFAADLATYASLTDTLYQSGARNFLFLNVPPVDRAPLTASQGAAAQAAENSAILAWNANVTALAANLSTAYADATAFVFDTHALFAAVLDDPAVYPQTAAYVNTTDYCEAYANGTPSWYTLNATCGVSVDEYFWLNSLHPTFRVHNATAAAIAEMLS